MATRRKRNINFLPVETRPETVIDISAYPVDIGVGELMRLTRERLGHELQSVANQLRIRLSYLEAIEDGRFRDLPGTTYAIGFVRSYADYLGLDGPDIVRRFREEAARIHGRTKLIFPALTVEGKIPRSAVLLLSVAALAVAYTAWYILSSWQDTELPTIAEVPDRLIALAPEDDAAPPRIPEARTADSAESIVTEPPTETPAPQPPVDGLAGPATTEPSAAAPVATAPEDTPAVPVVPAAAGTAADGMPPSPNVAVAAPPETAGPPIAESPVVQSPIAESPALPPAETATPSVAAPIDEPGTSPITVEEIPAAPVLPPDAPQEALQQAALVGGGKGVVLEARMDSWIKVVDANGKTVVNQVLKAGERYEVPDQPGLILRTGNAGGLEVIVGDQKAPPLGEVGAVFQNIVLERDRLLDGTAVTD